ncbi:MAG: head GIN domain-containing protein [Cyclobacteriaceae bacterium]|nr:head GIN domain-containing protein [Cyclobacteriaceae bacterium]
MMKKIQLLLLLIVSATATIAVADDGVEKKYTVKPFTELYLQGPYEIHLRQSDSYSLTIVTTSNYFERLEVNSETGRLEIILEGKNLRNTKAIEVWINVKRLEKLKIEGAVDLECENQLVTDNLKLEFDGAGDVELNLKAAKVISEISGVGDFTIEGEAEYHKVSFHGIGSYDASGLRSKYTLVDSNGIGSVKVYASASFKGQASGIGSVEYYGDPAEVDVDASGLGSVTRH